MRRIRAEESLRASTVISMGTGMLKKEDARAVRREWQRDIGRQQVVKPTNKEQFRVMVAAAGIGMN